MQVHISLKRAINVNSIAAETGLVKADLQLTISQVGDPQIRTTTDAHSDGLAILIYYPVASFATRRRVRYRIGIE